MLDSTALLISRFRVRRPLDRRGAEDAVQAHPWRVDGALAGEEEDVVEPAAKGAVTVVSFGVE